jgi:hypothetical protein
VASDWINLASSIADVRLALRISETAKCAIEFGTAAELRGVGNEGKLATVGLCIARSSIVLRAAVAPLNEV